jgi:hypothetical protein
MTVFEHAGLEIEVRYEPTYSVNSTDNLRRYEREIRLNGRTLHLAYGVTASGSMQTHSAVLLAGGAYSGVGERSAVAHHHRLYVACGNSVCALSLPHLTLAWTREVDIVACYALYLLSAEDGFISHGELEIARL